MSWCVIRDVFFAEVAQRMLERPVGLKFPPAAERVFGRVDRRVHPDDVFFDGDAGHYLAVGASALQVIDTALQLGEVQAVRSILDFGSGAGRVTRWLCAAFPESEIAVTDVRETDIAFCAANFRVAAWTSGTDIDALCAPAQYDLIWAGSVITHLPAGMSLRLLRKLMSWTRPGGLVIVSMHGRTTIDNRRRNVWAYLHDAGWQEVERDYDRLGYGYADYQGQAGYGIAVTSLDWIARRIMEISNARLVLLSERAWDNHHDVLALQIGCDGARNDVDVPGAQPTT